MRESIYIDKEQAKEFWPEKKMEWIRVKDKIPPYNNDERCSFVLAYHTIFGIGVAWFWKHPNGDGIIEEMEEDTEDVYLCSCHFFKNKIDENYSIDGEDNIDIFQESPHFGNLGTVTHWMPLPSFPKD